jgi:hypothetical protein
VKVAITNGWLVFDNELENDDNYVYRSKRGRVRLSDVVSYSRVYGDDGWWTLLNPSAGGDPWHVKGDHQELLDGYFGRSL